MAFDYSDFRLDEEELENTANPPIDKVLETVLQMVAFFVYDNAKMTEILHNVRAALLAEHGIKIVTSIVWNKPTVRVLIGSS